MMDYEPGHYWVRTATDVQVAYYDGEAWYLIALDGAFGLTSMAFECVYLPRLEPPE